MVGYSHLCTKLDWQMNGLLIQVGPTHMRRMLFTSDVYRTIPDIMFCLSIKEDMTWMVSSCGVEITSGSFIDSLPPKLDTVLLVISVLTQLNHCHICLGNAEGKFQDLQRNTRFLKSSGMGIM